MTGIVHTLSPSRLQDVHVHLRSSTLMKVILLLKGGCHRDDWNCPQSLSKQIAGRACSSALIYTLRNKSLNECG